MKTPTLIGFGPNSVEVPCMLFDTMDEGIVWLSQNADNLLLEQRYDSILVRVDDEDDPIFDKVFTSYYDGCGGVYAFVLKEVEHGVPFVPFSLD